MEYSGKKAYAYIPEELALSIKDLEDSTAYEKEILRYIEDSKLDMRASIEELDEAVILYRAKMIQARDAFKKAKEEELDANYTLWEEYEKDIKSTRQYVEAAKQEVAGLANEVEALNTLLYKFDVNRLNSFLHSLKQLQGFMSQEKDLAALVLNFYREGG